MITGEKSNCYNITLEVEKDKIKLLQMVPRFKICICAQRRCLVLCSCLEAKTGHPQLILLLAPGTTISAWGWEEHPCHSPGCAQAPSMGSAHAACTRWCLCVQMSICHCDTSATPWTGWDALSTEGWVTQLSVVLAPTWCFPAQNPFPHCITPQAPFWQTPA